MSFHQWWCAAISSSPSLQIPWKVSWVIYKILLSVSLSRNEEGNYLCCRWVMSPSRRRGILLVTEASNVTKKPTCGQRDRRTRMFSEGCSLDDWMLEQRHRWDSVLSEMGQGELMGSVHCIWIPFILVATSQSHLSPLPKSYSVNPLLDPTTHFGTGTVWIVLCHDSHNPLCLQTYVLCLAFFFVTIMSYHTFFLQLWWFCLLSAPLWFHCLHTLYYYLFLTNWSVCSPALNL